MRTWGLAWSVGSACLALGCATGATPMGGEWTEARSAHFVVKSDLEERELRELSLEFEESYRAIHSCLYPTGDDPPGEGHVVLLGSWEEFEAIRPEGSGAFYATRRSVFETTPMIVLPARKHDRMMEVFQHELVHRFIRHYFPAAPRWLHEGLAQVLSTAAIEDEEVVIGRELARMHWDGARWTVFGMSLPDLAPELAELTTMNSAIFMQEAVHAYPGSWAFVHTLMLGEPDHARAFGAYLSDLRDAANDEPQAFARHFDLLGPMGDAYRKRMATENLPTQAYPLAGKPTTDVRTRAMPSSEAFSLWGRLRMNTADGRNLAIRDAENAIASDPRSPEGYLLRATIRMRVGGRPDALKDIRRALEFSPDDQRLLRALGVLLLVTHDRTGEVDQVAAKVRARAASADDFHFLARYELSKQRAAPALELAVRAAREDEGCGPCFETAAVAAVKTGELERAVRFQETAVRVVSEFDDDMPRMEATLAKYRKLLAQKPAR